jgi:predicted nucleic acid-binding protein
MARPEVPDTTVFIRLTHNGASLRDFLRRVAGGNVWLSSVVVGELLAGTRSADEAQLVGRLASTMAGAERLITPTPEDWALAGRLMARRIRLHGALRPRDHFNDLLIVVSAAALKGVVTTANVAQLEAWASLARRANLDVFVQEEPAS